MLNDFTPEQTIRWDAWQAHNVTTARRSARVAQFFGAAFLLGACGAIAVAIWR